MGRLKDFFEGRGLVLKKASASQYSSPCPWCGGADRFCTWDKEERYWCRRCEKKGDYIQALIEIDGLTFKEAAKVAGKDLGDKLDVKSIGLRSKIKDRRGRTPDEFYTYFNSKGLREFYVARWNDGGPRNKKVFSIINTKGGWGAKGVRQMLYNLPDVMKSQDVFFVEGEKTADAVKSLGLTSTAIPGGTNNLNHLVREFDVLSPLVGKNVFIVPDQDDPGRKFAENLSVLLMGKSREVRIVEIPDSGVKGYDVYDYLEENGAVNTRKMLLERSGLAEKVKKNKPTITLAELLNTKIPKQEYIIDQIFPEKSHMLIAGEAGVGKSILRSEIALHLAYGIDYFHWSVPSPKRVAILQFENTQRMEQKRLGAMLKGLKVDEVTPNLEIVNNDRRWDLSDSSDRDDLLEFVKQLEAEVIIYDCLSNMHSSNENSNIEMRGVLDTLSHVNTMAGTACILIHHFGKPQPGTDDRYRVRGASAIEDWAVTVGVYTEWGKLDTEKEQLTDYRRLRITKVRDAPPQRTLYAVRSRETFLLSEVTNRSGMVRDWVKNEGGSFTQGRAKFIGEMMAYLQCSRRSAAMAIDIAVRDGFLAEYSMNGKVQYTSDELVDGALGATDSGQEQEAFDWKTQGGRPWE